MIKKLLCFLFMFISISAFSETNNINYCITYKFDGYGGTKSFLDLDPYLFVESFHHFIDEDNRGYEQWGTEGFIKRAIYSAIFSVMVKHEKEYNLHFTSYAYECSHTMPEKNLFHSPKDWLQTKKYAKEIIAKYDA